MAVAAVVAATTAVLLSACGAPGSADPTTSPSSTATDPSSTPEPTETVAPPTPFEIACDALVTPDQLYAFNPNYGSAPDYSPQAATVAKVVSDAAGTACGYLNQTSGDLIEIAVATPSADGLTAAESDAASGSNAVPTYGTPPAVSGFFDHTGQNGQVQVFSNGYWVVLDSPAFFEPGDAQRLVADVLSNLPAT